MRIQRNFQLQCLWNRMICYTKCCNVSNFSVTITNNLEQKFKKLNIGIKLNHIIMNKINCRTVF